MIQLLGRIPYTAMLLYQYYINLSRTMHSYMWELGNTGNQKIHLSLFLTKVSIFSGRKINFERIVIHIYKNLKSLTSEHQSFSWQPSFDHRPSDNEGRCQNKTHYRIRSTSPVYCRHIERSSKLLLILERPVSVRLIP